jgi:DeoR/GlpR family transcriptional regulator of sugar metabolism
MLMDARLNQILDIVKDKSFISVEDLSNIVYVSAATIRRDLTKLEKDGLIKRVRGGAAFIGGSTGEPSSLIRKQTNVNEKRRIAKAVASLFEDGKSYFLDSSSTASQLVSYLGHIQSITIITNSLENGILLSGIPNCNVYIAGGSVQPRAYSSVGPDTIDFISSFNCDAFFFSCHGFSIEAGPTEGTIEQQRCKEAMLKHSKTHILLVDHTKFDQNFVASVCQLADIDVIVTDEEPSQKYLEAFEKVGVKLIVASK